MDIAIVVLNYNDTGTTLSYLKTIRDYAVYTHVIVVDNASTDPTTTQIQACCAEIGADYLPAKENRGYASGNNIGIRYAIERYGSDIIFVSNPDIICSQETAAAVAKAFSEHERIGIASGLVHVYDSNHRLKTYSSFAYRTPTLTDMLLNCFQVVTKFRRTVLHTSMYYDATQVKENGFIYAEAMSGCFFAISREAFLDIDGLDEDTFLYGEEAILGQRLKKKGYRGVIIDALVIHDEKKDKAVGFKKLWRTHRLKQRSARVYLRKYLRCHGMTVAMFSVFSLISFAEKYMLSLVLR